MPEKFQARKFKELLVYLAQRSADDPLYGATKLNKLLFYCDFLAFGQFGRSVTGARYQKLRHGPAPRQLLPMQTELESEGAVTVQIRQFFNQVQRRPIALRPPDLTLFSGALSHLEAGWQLVDDGEDIPYETVFLSAPALTSDDIAVGQELWRAAGGFAAEA